MLRFSILSALLRRRIFTAVPQVPLRKFSMKPPFSTFVSQYHEVGNNEIRDFLNRVGLEYKETSNGFVTRYCPACPKPHYEDRTNLYTLNFTAHTGVFHCFRCGAGGSWYDFKNLAGGSNLKIDSLKVDDVKFPCRDEHETRVKNLNDDRYGNILLNLN